MEDGREGPCEVQADIGGDEDGEAYRSESSDCLDFSKIETVSAKTVFFLLRSFASASCSSKCSLTIFSSLLRKSISTSLGSLVISFLTLPPLFVTWLLSRLCGLALGVKDGTSGSRCEWPGIIAEDTGTEDDD